ncbi:MAG: endolytic transglycosylase MltG, partial [Bacteroidetes bacterium]
KKDLAAKITRNLEIDSLEVEKLLNDPQKTAELGFDTTNIMAMFIPNTYEMYWTSSADQLLKKMQAEYHKFWNEDRKAKAKALNLSEIQVSILASIVEAETKKQDEAPIIAGVYLNRLAKGEKLQADPTVIFGIGDFGIKRLLISHLQHDSPYNTYKYAGLPPGLINLPSVPSLEAVLNPQKHDYIFFCAKEDFSGYHNFAVSYNDHLKNAARYQAALNKLNIR